MKTIRRWATSLIAATALLASGAAGAQAADRTQGSQPANESASVPAGFHASAASFSSPSSGVVLGGVDCTVLSPCRAGLAATSNGGASWQTLAAPKVWVANAATATPKVSQVVFASRQNGWLYDQFGTSSVWATHDRGGHWTRLTLPGIVQAMAASASTVYAVVAHGTTDELYSSPANRNSWARVGTMSAPSASLAVLGRAAWFGASPQLYATTDGVHWHRYSFSCPAGLFLARIAPSSSSHVAFLCTFAEGTFHTIKAVLLSVNGGKTEHLTGHAPVEGDNAGFAAPQLSNVVCIAVITPGLDYVYRSANSGKTGVRISIAGTSGGAPLSSLQFVSHTVGWLVVGGAATPARLLRTSNAGASWQTVSF